jgi:hypothetical protein
MRFSEFSECISHCVPNVKYATVAAQVAMLGPSRVPLQLVYWIEPSLLNQTLRQAKSHGSIVSPLSSREVERASAHHVIDLRE